jgi:hypothetical protein
MQYFYWSILSYVVHDFLKSNLLSMHVIRFIEDAHICNKKKDNDRWMIEFCYFFRRIQWEEKKKRMLSLKNRRRKKITIVVPTVFLLLFFSCIHSTKYRVTITMLEAIIRFVFESTRQNRAHKQCNERERERKWRRKKLCEMNAITRSSWSSSFMRLLD